MVKARARVWIGLGQRYGWVRMGVWLGLGQGVWLG